MTQPFPRDDVTRARLIPPVPVAVAPMAGGPSTPELVAAVVGAGGGGFLAGGMRTAAQMRAQVDTLRALLGGGEQAYRERLKEEQLPMILGTDAAGLDEDAFRHRVDASIDRDIVVARKG